MQRRTLAALSLAALLVTAGCAGLTGNDGGASDAEHVKEDATAAMADVDTYRMEMEMNITANGRTLAMHQRGVFDHEAEVARVNATAMGEQTTTYIDGRKLYVNVAGEWRTQDISGSNVWENGTSAARQRQILESGNVSLVGGATVDGTETTVLRVDPDTEDLKALIKQQRGGQPIDGIGIENATYTMYVANETDLVRKVELSMSMAIDGHSAESNATITFSAYDEPVSIELPAAVSEDGDSESTEAVSRRSTTETASTAV